MKVNVLELIDFKKVDTLLEGFNKSTGFVTAILDLEGNVLSQSGWRQICTEFHRINPETAKKCTISDTVLAGKMGEGEQYHFYQCLNGLVDVAVPIIIGGKHIANLFSGQFFFEEPDPAFFIKQAEKYGFDKEHYLAALGKVPVISREKVKTAMDFLLNMTQLIAETTYQKLEQQELSDAILKSEERFKTFMEETPVYAYIKDGSLKHVFSNRKVLELIEQHQTGKTAESARTLFAPDIAEYLENADQQILSGYSKRIELEYKVEIGGQEKWLNDIKFALILADGTNGVGGLAFDITDRKLAENNLLESEKRYRSLFENMGSGFVLFEVVQDDNGTPVDLIIISANKGFELSTGLKIQEVTGKRLAEVLPGIERDPADWIGIYGAVALTGESRQFEQGSELLGHYYSINAFNAGPKQCAVTFQDITGRKRIEDAVRQKAEELRISNEELELFNRAAVGRELRMIELKEEVNELCRQLGEPSRHEMHNLDPNSVPNVGPFADRSGGGSS